MKKLIEGLMPNDLANTVLPVISVDEYEGKLDQNNIVVGFYVQDADPAHDLNRFLQKSAISFVDTEVSPAPNENGYFLVFLEFLRNDEFVKKLIEVLKDVQELVDIHDWQFKSDNNHDDVLPVTEENLNQVLAPSMQNLPKKEKNIQQEQIDMSIALKDTLIDSFDLNESNLSLTRRTQQLNLTLLETGSAIDTQKYWSVETPMSLTPQALKTENIFRYFLGENWNIESYKNYYLLTNLSTGFQLVAKQE